MLIISVKNRKKTKKTGCHKIILRQVRYHELNLVKDYPSNKRIMDSSIIFILDELCERQV